MHEKPSYRDHPLRVVQNRFEGQIPEIMYYLFKNGLLADTQLEKLIGNGEELLPDDLTLAGLEFTIKASKTQIESPLNLWLLGRFFLGGIMNASDGAHARHLHLDSPEGAVKDVLADRISENYMAIIIDRNRRNYKNCPENLEQNLRVSFQLSTLAKAACEITAVHTSEGGPGSMLERRQKLFLTLLNLGRLNHHSGLYNLSPRREQALLDAIDNRNRSIIDNSYDRAIKRVNAINQACALNNNIWDNPALKNPDSSAAVEARKYVAVIEMNQRMSQTNMVEHLNNFSKVVAFPSAAELKAAYPYIADSLEKTQAFLERSISIAYSNLYAN